MCQRNWNVILTLYSLRHFSMGEYAAPKQTLFCVFGGPEVIDLVLIALIMHKSIIQVQVWHQIPHHRSIIKV